MTDTAGLNERKKEHLEVNLVELQTHRYVRTYNNFNVMFCHIHTVCEFVCTLNLRFLFVCNLFLLINVVCFSLYCDYSVSLSN